MLHINVVVDGYKTLNAASYFKACFIKKNIALRLNGFWGHRSSEHYTYYINAHSPDVDVDSLNT